MAKDIDAISECHTLRYVESILDNVLMLLLNILCSKSKQIVIL